jgi:hypothetical protein
VEKNEVYDYLAKIYLDKQPTAVTKDKKKNYILDKKYPFFLITLIIAVSLYLLIVPVFKSQTNRINSLYLSTGNEVTEIKFDFTDSQLKKQGHSIEFPGLDVQKHKYLQLRMRRLKKYGALNLRVEIENALKEESSCYLTNISNKWLPYAIALSEFKGITQWGSIKRISFVVEEWNVENKDDCVYIDEIRFTQNK